MHRTSNTFSVLQAIAATVTFALILWTIGVPSFRFAEAASVTDFSNTLSTSEPSVVADHEIEFVSPTGVAVLEAIVLTFEAGAFDLSNIDGGDVDLLEDGVSENIGGTWSFASTSNSITLTSLGAGSIAAGATTTILIGLNATNEGSPDAQIVNPVAGSYQIEVAAGSADTGETRVAILDTVTVTAAVDTQFNFTVAGVAGGQTVNTADTTGGTTTATAIPFGELDIGTASTAAQDLTVVTNAANGFVVTVQTDQQLTSTNGADIDGFRNGTYDTTPTAWATSSETIGQENTYGHWGLTTDDGSIGVGLTDDFNTGGGGDRYVSASTTPVEIFRHTAPTDGTVTGEGTTRVGYKVQITALQEAADDYTATLTYVATPVF